MEIQLYYGLLNYLLFLFCFTCSASGEISEVKNLSDSADNPEVVTWQVRARRQNLICKLGLQGYVVRRILNILSGARHHNILTLSPIDEYNLQDGTLEGLSSLQNTTDLFVHCDDDKTTVSTRLALNDPVVTYSWAIGFWSIFSGKIRLSAKRIEIFVVVNLDSDQKVDLETTEVTKLENFNFEFSGLGPINFLISKSMNILHWLLETKAIRTLEKTIHRELQKLVVHSS